MKTRRQYPDPTYFENRIRIRNPAQSSGLYAKVLGTGIWDRILLIYTSAHSREAGKKIGLFLVALVTTQKFPEFFRASKNGIFS